jgi:hypothetical protein
MLSGFLNFEGVGEEKIHRILKTQGTGIGKQEIGRTPILGV